jgi:phosphonate transport system substrate-binding protein
LGRWPTLSDGDSLDDVPSNFPPPPVVDPRCARFGTPGEAICKTVLDALVAWVPKWETVYGAFRPYYYADVHCFFHDLDQLPAGM